MEVLAVLLVIALILSLAVPVLRTVRFEVKNSQAKAATIKLAEAVKTYYNVSRGHGVTGCFTPTTSAGKTIIQKAGTACTFPGATGIPGYKHANTNASTVDQLFACGYLQYKDFAGLPYTFCPLEELPSGVSLPALPSGVEVVGRLFARTYSTDDAKAGSKYNKTKGYMFVDAKMKVRDTYE